MMIVAFSRASRVTRAARASDIQSQAVTKAESAWAVAATRSARRAAGRCGRDSSASRISPSPPNRSSMRRIENSGRSAPGLTASEISASRAPTSASAAATARRQARPQRDRGLRESVADGGAIDEFGVAQAAASGRGSARRCRTGRWRAPRRYDGAHRRRRRNFRQGHGAPAARDRRAAGSARARHGGDRPARGRR